MIRHRCPWRIVLAARLEGIASRLQRIAERLRA
jgi:hypothetical protein